MKQESRKKIIDFSWKECSMGDSYSIEKSHGLENPLERIISLGKMDFSTLEKKNGI